MATPSHPLQQNKNYIHVRASFTADVLNSMPEVIQISELNRLVKPRAHIWKIISIDNSCDTVPINFLPYPRNACVNCKVITWHTLV